jgi:8-oxo-dGTP pyrophosphatase MutT (NUDIX family)
MDGELPRRQALGVLGWVRRGEAVLLVRRRDPAAALDSRWELPGGKIDFGEQPEVAVAREVLEETGYAINVRSLLPYIYSTVWARHDRTEHIILLVFDCAAGERIEMPRDPRVAEVAWRRPWEIDFDQALPSVQHFVEWWTIWQQGDGPA